MSDYEYYVPKHRLDRIEVVSRVHYRGQCSCGFHLDARTPDQVVEAFADHLHTERYSVVGMPQPE
jgi:hypothetical protein